MKVKICRCNALDYPHILDCDACRQYYNSGKYDEDLRNHEVEDEQDDDGWRDYLSQRNVNDVAMHQSGMSNKDFI